LFVNQIHKLLAARVEAKFRADFARADNIQVEICVAFLMTKVGLEVNKI
jgi:hypothetical protein